MGACYLSKGATARRACGVVGNLLRPTGYDCCGVAVSEDDLAALRADVGVLSERRWQMLDWEIPADEACPCWWVSTVDGLTFTTAARYPLDSPAHQPASWNACELDKS